MQTVQRVLKFKCFMILQVSSDVPKYTRNGSTHLFKIYLKVLFEELLPIKKRLNMNISRFIIYKCLRECKFTKWSKSTKVTYLSIRDQCLYNMKISARVFLTESSVFLMLMWCLSSGACSVQLERRTIIKYPIVRNEFKSEIDIDIVNS